VIPLLSLSSLAPELQQLIQQRQHQPYLTQSSLLPHPVCELDPAALTKRIKRCSSWRDAAVLFAQQAPCLNHINLSALLVRLAHLPACPSSRPANWQPFVRQVLATSQPLLQFAEPRQLANMAWALAKLGLHEWCGVDAAVLFSSNTGGGSSSSIYGTQASVSSSSSSDGSRHTGSTGSNNSSSVLWGAAWQQQVLHTLHAASCCDVSNILWALATSGAHRHQNCSSIVPLPGQPSRQDQRQQQQQQQQSGQVHSRLLQALLSALHRTLPDSRPQVGGSVWPWLGPTCTHAHAYTHVRSCKTYYLTSFCSNLIPPLLHIYSAVPGQTHNHTVGHCLLMLFVSYRSEQLDRSLAYGLGCCGVLLP